jgi:hypothetical protein
MVKRRGKSRAVLLLGGDLAQRTRSSSTGARIKRKQWPLTLVRAAIDAVSTSLRSKGLKSDQDCASARCAIR